MKKLYMIPVIFLSVFLLSVQVSFADDLDDGISKFTDDGVSQYDEIGKADKNIKFIVMNAKSKANVRKGDAVADGKKSGDANMNSVILGAGSKVKGDIYIIDQSKGPKTNVAD